MTSEEKIDALREYLNVALKNDVLLETVWVAFKLQEKKGHDINRAFEESLWGCLTYNAKNTDRERISDIIDDD